jgi:hypothetical protein
MYSSVFPALGWLLLLGTLGLAWWKGAPPERLGALAIFITAIEVWLIETFAPDSAETLLLLISDGILAAVFLLLAVRYASLWLGLAMLFQAGQFALHALYATTETAYDRRYAIVNNIVTVGILLVILTATIASWRRRLAKNRALASDPTPGPA